MAEFDIPVEDFEALQSMVEAGDLSAAMKRFRELTKVSLDDAELFVQGMAAGNGATKSISEDNEAKVGGENLPEPKPVYSSIPLPISTPLPVYTSIPLPTSTPRSVAAEPSRPTAVSSASAPVKPPAPEDAMTMIQPNSAAGLDIDGEGRVSGRGRLRWYERMLALFSIPLLWGGLLGGLFCALAFAAVLMILKSSPRYLAGRCLGAILALAGSYAGYLAVVGEVPREFSLLGAMRELTKPVPIEPSSTHDWNSPAGSVVEGTDAELQTILDLDYRPLEAFPTVSTAIEDSTLTVVSEEVKVDGALVGVPLLEQKRDLVADFGRGFNVTLVKYAMRFPWDEPGAPLEYIDTQDPPSEAAESFGDIPVSIHRKRPVLRCIFRFGRTSADSLVFHLFDARSGRKVSSAKPTRAGEVDFDMGIWHQTPLLMVVEADAWASSSSRRRPLPVGEDLPLGLGRAQLAYVGPGRLDGLANGATIECGQPYRLVGADKPQRGGMVIVRYAPPYLAESTSLLMVATRDHLVSSIPAFGDFELKPLGADGDRLGFRVFHIPPTIDDRLYGRGLGLQPGSTRASRTDAPTVERAVDFASDRLSVVFESQRGRGLIALNEVAGMQTDPESDNLFDVKIPLIVFEESDSLRLLLEFAVDAVEFDLQEADDRKLKLPAFRESIEYRDVTPRQALLNFEQMSGVRVLVDSDQRRIRLQP